MIESAFASRYPKKSYAFKQISLFTEKIRSAYLVAWESPRKAFYRIWIEDADGQYSVVKESGVKGLVLERTWLRHWRCSSAASGPRPTRSANRPVNTPWCRAAEGF